MTVLQDALVHLTASQKNPDAPAHTSGIFRGDSFQLAMADVAGSLRAVLRLKASVLFLAGIRIRVAIAVGPVTHLDQDAVEGSFGPAFVLSGRLIDRMPAFRHLAIGAVDNGLNDRLAILGPLLDVIIQAWTVPQAEALLPWLDGHTQSRIAGRLGISQPAVQQRIRGAGGFALADTLQFFERVIGLKADNEKKRFLSL
jgi:hypothetical protein